MTATISFHAGTAGSIQNLAGSGLGFYGASFGQSVEVGSYQDSTYITDSTGADQGPAVENAKYLNSSGVYQDTAGEIHLNRVPNRLATLNMRFENDTAVKTQNVKLRIFDRSNINNPASGVLTKVAELVHPDINQANVSNSSDSSWSTPAGSGTVMTLLASPGTSGERPAGAETSDTRHDWYVLISASPNSIGSKTLYGLYIELEYL